MMCVCVLVQVCSYMYCLYIYGCANTSSNLHCSVYSIIMFSHTVACFEFCCKADLRWPNLSIIYCVFSKTYQLYTFCVDNVHNGMYSCSYSNSHTTVIIRVLLYKYLYNYSSMRTTSPVCVLYQLYMY